MSQTLRIGTDGPEIQRMGYGAMVLEGYYGSIDEADAVAVLQRAIDLGMMIDSADAYGGGRNETLLARAVADRRERAVIATKFGIVFEKGVEYRELPTGWGFSLRLNGSPDYARRCLENSLERLGTDRIDLWYLHYTDPGTPIEETVAAMAEGVTAGKVRQLGLSNPTADELRRAHAVHPIAAVQYEYSLWRREPERELLPTARELGATLVAWSPLGAGFFGGELERVEKTDFRHNNPRLRGANLDANRDRFAPLIELAGELGITPAQLALAWLASREGVLPIPGTRRPERLEENLAAARVELDSATLARIDELAPAGLAEGGTIVP